MKELRDKIAVVTGAAQGIGRETALVLAREGCHLALCDLDMEGLEETARLARGFGRKAITRKVDTSDRDGVYAFAEEVGEAFGGVDILVNNAGVALTSGIREMEYEDFEWVMNINFWGMVYGTKAFLPLMEGRPEGHLVNISSVFGLWAIPTQAAYNCSKFAIRGFTEALGMELSGTGIRVTSVHPGGIRTNIARNSRFRSCESPAPNKDEAVKMFDKMAATSASDAAKAIVNGIKRNKRRVLIGKDAYIMDFTQRLFPSLYQKIIPALDALRERRKKGA